MATNAAQAPQGILTDPRALELARSLIRAGHPELTTVWQAVLHKAEGYLKQRGLSVTENTRLPPSGDKHDYLSVATYWWPNPATSDGLPYVRRDGEINPEFFDSDVDRIRKLSEAVQYLSLAAVISLENRFAIKAAELVRHWFLAPETRMNPHLSYAQFVPGLKAGRSYGIIDFKPVRELLDALRMLPANAWSPADQSAMLTWMRAYLKWLTTSKFGHQESSRQNNHGTWYDAQALAVALFVEDEAIAHGICERAKERIAVQITPAGEQPEELARTRPITYCMMNLQAFFDIATMAERCGHDLWTFKTRDGRSLRGAAEWLLPFVAGEQNYSKSDIVKEAPQNYLSVFRRAAIKFADDRFEMVVRRFSTNGSKASSPAHLLQFPYLPGQPPAPPVATPSPQPPRISFRRLSPVIFVGGSHTLSVIAAARIANVQVGAINLKHAAAFADDSEQALHPSIVEKLASKTIVSLVGGNMHNELALVRHPRPFDFVLPLEPSLPVGDGELIPAEALQSVLRKRMSRALSIVSLLKRHANGPMFHLESPPPIAEDDYIKNSIDKYFEKRGVAELGIVSRSLRYKLWRLHSEIVRSECQRLQIEFVPCPEEAIVDGFLRQDLRANATHANERYGAMLLAQTGVL